MQISNIDFIFFLYLWLLEVEEISMVSVDSSAIVEGPQSRDFEVSLDFEGVEEFEEEGVPPILRHACPRRRGQTRRDSPTESESSR